MYQPQMALVVSRTPSQKNDKAQLHFYRISAQRLHSPRRVTSEDMRALAEAIGDQKEQPYFKGLLPEEVFYLSGTKMAFYLPAGIRRAFFRADEGKADEVLLWLPAMVFHYGGPQHSLFAYFCTGSFKELREDKAMLIGALLPNITRGNVCLGSSMAQVRFDTDPGEMMEIIIERFFGSMFNEWRYKGMRELIEQFIDMAKDPDVLHPETHVFFWKNMPKLIKDHAAKEDPWKRPSHLFR